MEKIKEYKVSPRGLRGAIVGLPKVWLDDTGVVCGDTIEFYRNSQHDLGDVLILRRKK